MNTPEDKQWDLQKIILLTGLGSSMLVTIILVSSPLILMVVGQPIPDALNQWAGIALGFLFGTFGSILKDFVTK